jgi:hypothetical protein
VKARLLALFVRLGAVASLLTARAALADESREPDAFARVVVDSAELRTGPGISYRVVSTAPRGETFPLEGRPGTGFWLKVLLPDGRIAYVLGDEVQTFSVKPGEEGAPSRPGFLAPPPLEGARGGMAIVAGVLDVPIADGSRRGFGFLELKPSLVVHKTVTLEGFGGIAVTADGSQVLYGGSVMINVAPDWPVCPFLGLGGGGLSVFPAADSFVLRREDMFVGRAGGGVLFALKNRILVRLEATNMTLFTAESFKNAQTYEGGLGVYF